MQTDREVREKGYCWHWRVRERDSGKERKLRRGTHEVGK
jgi:hypothetical protein